VWADALRFYHLRFILCLFAFSAALRSLRFSLFEAIALIPTMTVKIVNYLQAGVAVWWFIPEHRMVQVFVPNQKPAIPGINDTLSDGAALPGFSLTLRSLYRD
jgi:hypothetical protein